MRPTWEDIALRVEEPAAQDTAVDEGSEADPDLRAVMGETSAEVRMCVRDHTILGSLAGGVCSPPDVAQRSQATAVLGRDERTGGMFIFV